MASGLGGSGLSTEIIEPLLANYFPKRERSETRFDTEPARVRNPGFVLM